MFESWLHENYPDETEAQEFKSQYGDIYISPRNIDNTCPICEQWMEYSAVLEQYKCMHCGHERSLAEARAEQEAIWEASLHHVFKSEYEVCEDYEDYRSCDPEGRPFGCSTCENPDWPDCKYSCPIFDI